MIMNTRAWGYIQHEEKFLFLYLREEDNLTRTCLHKGPVPNLSLVERLHSPTDKGPVPNLSLVERLHSPRDKGPVPNFSLLI